MKVPAWCIASNLIKLGLFLFAPACMLCFLLVQKDFERKSSLSPSNTAPSTLIQSRSNTDTMPRKLRSTQETPEHVAMSPRLSRSHTCVDLNLSSEIKCYKCKNFESNTRRSSKKWNEYSSDRYACEQPWDEQYLTSREDGKKL